MQISRLGAIASICLISISVTGCKDENASMYVVTPTQTVSTEPVVEAKDDYSYMEAQVSDGADSDKKLGKKHIVEINGQPIAELVDTYKNDYGYVTESNSTPESTASTESEDEDTSIVSVEADDDIDMSDVEEWLASSKYDSIYDAFSDLCAAIGLKYSGASEYNNTTDTDKVDHVMMPGATYKLDSNTFFMIELWIPEDDNTLPIEDKLAELQDELPFYDLNISSSGKFIYGTVINGNSGTNTELGNALLKTILALSMADKQIYG